MNERKNSISYNLIHFTYVKKEIVSFCCTHIYIYEYRGKTPKIKTTNSKNTKYKNTGFSKKKKAMLFDIRIASFIANLNLFFT